MKTGIFTDSNEIYHGHVDHIGSSSVKQMAVSPAHFYEAWKGKKKESKVFDEGRAVHETLLEQTTDKFVRRPDGVDGRTKEGKAALAALEETGRAVLTADVFDSLERRLGVFTDSLESMSIYDGAGIETSHYAEDPDTGLFLKARPDILKPGMIADLKTTQNMRMFERQVWNLGYHIQVGFYSIVIELTTGEPVTSFKFIAQEKSAPYGIRVFALDAETVTFCKLKARELINRVAVSIEQKSFPSYDDHTTILLPPPWIFSDGINFGDEFSVEESA